MARIPPPPAGFSMIGSGPDPYDELVRRGFTPTNGFRTDEDMDRLRRAGYHPAPNSLHRDGDATDFRPPAGMSFSEARRVAQEASAGWQGSKVLNEGDHIHAQWPGYGRAPGTPGTDRFGLPPLPAGFELIQRGSLTGGNYNPNPMAQPSSRPAPAPQHSPQPAAAPLSFGAVQRMATGGNGFPAQPSISQQIGSFIDQSRQPSQLPQGHTPAPMLGAPQVQMSDNVFSARLGAIARDPDLRPEDRYRRLSNLARIAGKPIADEDLQFLAKGQGGQIAYTPGQGGRPGTAAPLNMRPETLPSEKQARGFDPNAGYDPNLTGLNKAVRGILSSKLSNDQAQQQVWGLLTKYGIDPSKYSGDMSVVTGLQKVLQWRAANPGRPYRGTIDLERLPYANAPKPDAKPLQTQREALDEYIDRIQGGRQVWDGPITPSHPLGRTTKEQVAQVFRGFGYSDPEERADTAAKLPFTGGFMSLDQGVRDLTGGRPVEGAGGIALGTLDFIPGGKGAKAGAERIIDTAAMRVAGKAADGTIDAARATEHLRSAVDDALANRGSVTLNIGDKSHTIVGTNDAGLFIDDSGKAWTSRTILEPRRGEDPHMAIHMPEASQAPARLPHDVPNTRGQGTFYHGARGEVPELTEGHYNPSNIYGGIDTFYTTDAADVAKGYGRKREAARIYQTAERAPVKFYDMEQPQPAEHFNQLFGVHHDDIGLTPMAIDEAVAEHGSKTNLRNVMDSIRDLSAGEGVSKDEVQETFDAAISNLREQGFGGMTHVGGLKTGRDPHTVRIYFDAHSQLGLHDVTPMAPRAVQDDIPPPPAGFSRIDDTFGSRLNAREDAEDSALRQSLHDQHGPTGGNDNTGLRATESLSMRLRAIEDRMWVNNQGITDQEFNQLGREAGAIKAQLGDGAWSPSGGRSAGGGGSGGAGELPPSGPGGGAGGGGDFGGGGGLPPRRQPDYLSGFNPGEVPPPPPGFHPIDDPQLGRLRPMGQQATPEEMAAAARGFRPEDVRPIPGNRVESAEEAARIPSSQRLLPAPNEFDELGRRKIPSANDLFKSTNRRGPLDLSQRIRQLGGIQDQGGELSSMGITNAPRRLDFGNDRGLGNLIKPDGVPLDEMTRKLHEEGWFPHEADRPTPEVLLDALRDEHVGGSRVFHPDDQAEVERFYATQAERGRVETAAQEGSPLVEHVGQPAGLEDLRAIDEAMPATAYEDLPKVGGKVANINLANLETRGDIRRALQNVEVRFGGFDAARRGQITHAETAALASELKMTPDDLLRRRKGQALNAEQALAARQILAKSSDELLNLARKVEGGTEEDLAVFHKGLLRHAAIQEQVSGAAAEAGRTLSQFRMLARSKAVPGRVLDAVIDSGGGKERIEDAARAILDLKRQGADAGQINSFARDAMKPRMRDKLTELYINSLLSGPQTHAVNFVSNLITQIGQVPEHVVAAGLGAGRRGVNAVLSRQMASDAVTFSEVGARAMGMVSGVKRGLLNGAKTFVTEIPSDMVGKVEHMTQHAIGGPVGKALRVPTRALSASDEVFKGIARRSAMDGLAMRQAWKEGNRGAALRQRAAELAATPTPEIVAEAFDYGRYVTFQRPTGDVGAWVTRMKQKHPALVLIAPFVRTPANLLKFSLERTPLAPVIKSWRQDFAAGGAKRDLAIARAAVGSGIGALTVMWAQQGLISGGGPADRGAGNLMRADDWQPYSIKVGGKWISYARLDPYSTVLGLAADLATKSDHMTNGQHDKAAAVLVGSVLRQMENKTWISGFTKLVKGVDELARGQTTDLQDWFDSTASGAAVPTLLAQTARTIDPVQRDTRDFAALPSWADSTASRIISRVPGLSRSLPAKTDVFGQPVTGDGGVGPDILSPLWESTPKHDPVVREMLRLDVSIGNVQRVVKGNRLGLDQFQGYKQRAGQYIHEGLSQAVNSPDWRGMDDGEQRRWMKEIMRDARAAARDDLGLAGEVDENGGSIGSIPPPPPGFQTVPPPPGYHMSR